MYRRFINYIAMSLYSREQSNRAQHRKMLWAIAYGFLGWNLFAMVIYATGKAGDVESKEARQRLFKKLHGEDGEINNYRVQGLTYVGKETVHMTEGNITESFTSPEEESTSSQGFKWPSKHLITRHKYQDEVKEVVDDLPSEQ